MKRKKSSRTRRNPSEDHSAGRLLRYIQSMPPDPELATRLREVVKERHKIKLRHYRINRPKMAEMKFEIPVADLQKFRKMARAVYGEGQLAIEFAAHSAINQWVTEHEHKRQPSAIVRQPD